MTEEHRSTTCRDCGKEIHWHRSKAGKPYPCDSASRTDFHKCTGKAELQATVPAPAPPATPESVAARLTHLESAVRSVLLRLSALEGGKTPTAGAEITDQDIPF